MIPKPIENSYWVVEGKFLAGEYPRSIDGAHRFAKLHALESAGVTHLIDLTEEGELKPYSHRIKSAQHLRFPIRDVSIPRSSKETVSILDAIDDGIGSGGVVYLHCWGGVGRTGTMVGCWLSRHGKLGDSALDSLTELWKDCPKSAWKSSPSTEDQRDYIRNWHEP